MRIKQALLAAGLLALAAAGCGKTKPGVMSTSDSGTPSMDTGPSTPEVPPAFSTCLDSPNELARPPSGQLPCELIPPKQ